jgi:uncharacterized protein (DUF427 family)
MTTQAMKPSADHPITIEHSPAHIVVSFAGKVIADTKDALSLHESTYPAVFYVPRKDVDMQLLQRTDKSTHCPYKGDASYYSIPMGGERLINAIWTYEQPFDAVAAIKDHLAFYADRVEIAEV